MTDPFAVHDVFSDIRREVGKLCDAFPGEYWRALDRARE